MATFSTGERKKSGRGDRRAAEIGLVLRQVLEAVIPVQLFPRSQIDMYVQVLQADGGTRCAALNAASLALANAGVPLRDLVAACAAGYLNQTPLLDLNYMEDAAGGVDLPVAVLPSTGQLLLLQMDSRLPLERFGTLLELAADGARQIHAIMLRTIHEYTQALADQRALLPATT
jgi:exosome complex component RRP41